jgi:hypothetical protein
MISRLLRVAATALALSSFPSITAPTSTSCAPAVSQRDCNGQYTYNEPAGYGFPSGEFWAKFGDINVGIESSATIDKKAGSLTRRPAHIPHFFMILLIETETHKKLWTISQEQEFLITFTPKLSATVSHPLKTNIQLAYLDTILYKGPDGKSATDLDADTDGFAKFLGFPDLLVAIYTGDGFGGPGPSIHAEGIVLSKYGVFWISDEYGPYIYQFNVAGLMVGATRPPDAILSLRNGTVSFSAASPRDINITLTPKNPTQGHQNNQGLEGLTTTAPVSNFEILLYKIILCHYAYFFLGTSVEISVDEHVSYSLLQCSRSSGYTTRMVYPAWKRNCNIFF